MKDLKYYLDVCQDDFVAIRQFVMDNNLELEIIKLNNELLSSYVEKQKYKNYKTKEYSSYIRQSFNNLYELKEKDYIIFLNYIRTYYLEERELNQKDLIEIKEYLDKFDIKLDRISDKTIGNYLKDQFNKQNIT